MKRTKKLKVVMGVLFALSSSKAFSQGYIEGGFIPNRDFLDDEKNKLGSSNEWQIAGKYTMPFSVKKETYSSFCRLKSSLHSIFTHVSPIQYTFSTKLMV